MKLQGLITGVLSIADENDESDYSDESSDEDIDT